MLIFQEDIQGKFEREFTSLEFEIRKRDEIISQLQARIQELENQEVPGLNDSPDDSTEPDVSMESDTIESGEEHPFMRDGSVDTVLTARPRHRRSSPMSHESSRHRRSWEEHSEEETLELQDLPRSISPQSLWKDDVAIELESNSDESKSDDDTSRPGRRRRCASDDDDEDDEFDTENEPGHNNWEVTMLAKELEARRRSSEGSSPGS